MRWIVIVMLMCNGIYFLWQVSLPKPAEMTNREARFANVSGSGQSLQLLIERQELAAVEMRLPDEELSAPPVSIDDEQVVAVSAEDEFGESQALPAEPNICWLIGPFKEQISGKQVVARLQALDINLRLKNIEIAGKPDYWVHIPPLVSRKAAVKLLRELQSKKVDSFLITEGELANGISLGFFTQKDSAEKVFRQRIGEGYDAKVKEVPRVYSELWAIFDTGEYGKFSNVLWEKIKEGNQGLERRKNYCHKIASVGNLD